MSLGTWEQEFYIHVEECTKGHEARASRQKWEGLKPENLERHGIEKQECEITDNIEEFFIDGTTCHLCKAVLNEHGGWQDCDRCVGTIANGRSCEYKYDEEDEDPPYSEWVRTGDPAPMLAWLDKAVELEIKLEKESA